MAIYQLGDLVPDVHPSAYVAESATVIGRVKLEANTTVWSNVTIRGDNDQITIGENSNIQESAVLHTDPGFLLTAERIKAWEAEHGAINAGEWVVMRTDWYKRNGSEAEFLNADETGPHTPGPTQDAIEYLISRDVMGWGSETIGTDAGSAGGMPVPFPAHTLMHKANKYGLASLCQLDRLPPKGAILIAAPLKIQHGTGSPIRALALVPRG